VDEMIGEADLDGDGKLTKTNRISFLLIHLFIFFNANTGNIDYAGKTMQLF
jgi:hypothetical protein